MTNFLQLDIKIQAALISALTTLIVMLIAPVIKHRLEINKLNNEYKYQSRKKTKNLIGHHLGKLTNACQSFNHRMQNLYVNDGKNWLEYNGEYDNIGYYMKSMLYRFTKVMHHAKEFEDKQLYIDSRKSDARDMLFVYYAKSLLWVMSDVALFKNINYDYTKNRDHFYSDEIRSICNACEVSNAFPEIDSFHSETLKQAPLLPVLKFFDGLSKVEGRIRWDRLVCLHLLITSFLDTFGDDSQKTSEDELSHICSQVKNTEVLKNLLLWIDRLGFKKHKEIAPLKKAIQSSIKFRWLQT